jgi:hypothetical protein
MTYPRRARVVSDLLAVVLLGITGACTTAPPERGGNPQMTSADEQRCVHEGGSWRNGICDAAGGGAGGY